MRTNAHLPRPLAGSRPTAFGAALFCAFLLISFAASSAALAAPATLWQVPASGPGKGSGAREIDHPRGVATDPGNGHVFVVDRTNARIDEFTAWGEFVKAFGWNVNAASPAAELQTCTSETGCKAGTEGGGEGQFAKPVAIAVASSHHIFVAEEQSHRIQVFDQNGAFLFMLGGNVNKTNILEPNRCPVNPSDVCQGGDAGTGPGEFSIGIQTGLGRPAGYLAIGPGDTLYAGDVERIQKFSAQGLFQGEITGPSLSGEIVSALEVDPDGDLYATLKGPESPFTEYSLAKLGPAGEILQSYPVPSGVDVGGLGLGRDGELYAVFDRKGFGSVRLEPRVVEFDAAGGKLLPSKEEEEAEEAFPPAPPFAQVTLAPNFGVPTTIDDLATSGACGLPADDIFASYNEFIGTVSLVRAYGPNPDPTICAPPEAPPSITDQFASAVGVDQASLQAQVNSHFWLSTTYYVEYGLGKCSEGACQNRLPVPPAPLDSGSDLPVLTGAVVLPGLTPATTYHFRFVATTRFQGGSEEEAVVRGVGGKPGLDGGEGTFITRDAVLPARVDCPNQQFRIGPAEFLSDCRAYELVSPIDKGGSDIVAVNAPVAEIPARLDQSATSGEALTYSSYRAFADPAAAPYSSQYLSRRGTDGWSTESISPGRGEALASVIETGDTEYQAFSGDLCQGWLRLSFFAEPQLDPAELREFPNLFSRSNCVAQGSGGYRALTTVEPPHLPVDSRQLFTPLVQGVSADGRCTVFRAPDTLTPEAPLRPLVGKEGILYEDCGGTLRLVAVLPDGSPSQSSSIAGVGIPSEDLSQLQLRGVGSYRAVSEDGTSIYWTVGGEGPGTLYRRINADKPQSAIVSGECSEPENACTLPVSKLVSNAAARFWTASADGSRAIFSVGERLYGYTAADPAEPEVALLAEGVADPMGMLGASEDASRIYFASRKALATGAVAGKPNLYFLELGEEARLLGILDQTDLNISGNNQQFESKAIAYEPSFRAARVSPDGLQAAFMSSAPLTNFDNTDQRNGEADRELFVYDAGADGGEGRLVCVSCDPTGARPLGRDITISETRPAVWAAARIPTWTSSLYPGNPLTSDGSTVRLFFDSFVPLSSRDINGHADVYEWQSAGGTAACEEAGAERYVPAMAGCLSLISSGQGDQDSEFIDADPAGRNVFFAIGESLLPQDPGLIDIYNAREGGGFPVPQAQPPCEGEACQHGSPAPVVPGPVSNVPRQGNPKPPKHCPQGKRQVKRKGGRTACVPKKHKRQAGTKKGGRR
ncbi:MAG TPA: NHL repeat-containing protein [Solirubrobacterales bacterium]|jgi:hypothetical protein|nr:NHL repeat-containing protein [Solirubrobacterales bacterium]